MVCFLSSRTEILRRAPQGLIENELIFDCFFAWAQRNPALINVLDLFFLLIYSPALVLFAF